MTPKVLVADPKKCTGCKRCELACSLKQTGVINPVRSRIRIIDWGNEGIYMPVSCQQCEDAPCMAVCPKEAIYRDNEMERIMVNYDLCVGCRMCLFVCPYGAMGFEAHRGMVFKCDLCDGDPQCVHFCDPKALTFITPSVFQYQRSSEAARKFTGVRCKS